MHSRVRWILRAVMFFACLPALSQPAVAKWDVVCADGSPCPMTVSREVRPCCLPHACKDEPQVPQSGRQCIVRVTPPSEYWSARATVPNFAATIPLYFHPLTIALAPSTPPPSLLSDLPAAEPPWEVFLASIQSPRAPPALH